WRTSECLRLRHFYLAVLLVVCAVTAWHPLRSAEDFWAHAAVGRWIWQQHEVPRHTLFLWSDAQPWVAHSWLSQLAFFALAVLDEGGDRYWVTPVFVALLVAMPFALLGWLWGRRAGARSLMLVAFALAIQASVTRFRARPELFTAVFYSCLLALL